MQLIENFVTEDEETEIVTFADSFPWKMSQSGRNKQDFGPKVNFKKRKVKIDGFTGLPPFSRNIVARMHESSLLQVGSFLPLSRFRSVFIDSKRHHSFILNDDIGASSSILTLNASTGPTLFLLQNS